MAIISSGQITIIDLYDAPTLNAWISAKENTTQTYNNTAQTYSPNYTTTQQELTLNLTKAGSAASLLGSDVISLRWTKKEGTTLTEITSTKTSDNEHKKGTNHSVLVTKKNTSTTANAVTWTADGVWKDPTTGLLATFRASITLVVVQLAKASVLGNVYAPNGDFFRNDTPASLKINADLYKDGVLSVGSKKFKWFVADSSVTTSQDSDAGIGWRKVTATSGTTGVFANVGFDVVTSGQGVLTVYPDAVASAQVFLVVITDNAGGTSGTKVKHYITLRDMDDPIQLVIESTGGNMFKNGDGNTQLKAVLYQMGYETDISGTRYTYKWSKWQDNVMVPNFGGSGNPYKIGKTLNVGSADVDRQTTFKVEVSE